MVELNILDRAREKVQDLMKNNDPSHDWFHVQRVYQNAMNLYTQELPAFTAQGIELDFLVIQLAALFHDVADFKYEFTNSKTLEEILEDRLGEFFQQFQSECSKEQKDKVLYIISNMSWRKELEQKGNSPIPLPVSKQEHFVLINEF